MLLGKQIIAVCLAGIHDETNINLILRLNEALVPKEYRMMVFKMVDKLMYQEKIKRKQKKLTLKFWRHN